MEDSSGSPTPHYWDVCYWQIKGDGGGGLCLWLYTNRWLYQAPVNNSNLVLTQMVLVKRNGSQNETQSHQLGKGAGRDEGGLWGWAGHIRECSERGIRIHYVCVWNCQVKLIVKKKRFFSPVSFKALQPDFSEPMRGVIPHIHKCPQRWLMSSRLSWNMLQDLIGSRYRMRLPGPFTHQSGG